MTMDLYALHSTPTDGEFIIQKFDTDYTCQSVYACSLTTCMCPQGHKPKCRHRTMLSMFLAHGHIGDGWFLEWNTRMWRKPVNDVSIEPVSVADDLVLGTSAGAGEGQSPSHAPGAATATPSPPPPSPPEGLQPAQAAEAAPVSPVVAGAPIVKRRKVS
jgi:hypothetical protein